VTMRVFEEASEAVAGRVGGAVAQTLAASVKFGQSTKTWTCFRITDGPSTMRTMSSFGPDLPPAPASIHPTRLAPLAGSVELAGRCDMPVDIARDAFEWAVGARRFGVSRPFAPWLHRIVVNPARDRVRGEHSYSRSLVSTCAGRELTS
jgi:hypothetical protein